MPPPLVGIIMGSKSDWETMSHAADTLESLGVPYEYGVVSAHRTPQLLVKYATTARERGLRIIIAGAGGAAHLPGMCASMTPLPVLGVPVESKALKGLDSLLSIAQMPAGIPVGTLAIGKAGAINAALLAAAILATTDAALAKRLDAYRAAQTNRVLADPDPSRPAALHPNPERKLGDRRGDAGKPGRRKEAKKNSLPKKSRRTSTRAPRRTPTKRSTR
jgi:5-(carboxyamino)imidazole ribonucleotide mutase